MDCKRSCTKLTVMNQITIKQFWTFAKKGWPISIVAALLLTAIPFKDIIFGLIKVPEVLDQLAAASPFWHTVVKGSVTDKVGNAMEAIRPGLLAVAAVALLIYSVASGYRKSSEALINNRNNTDPAKKHSSVDVTLRSIAVRSLFINVPILYWAIFLFLLLPPLIKLPVPLLSTGNVPGFIGVCIGMVLSFMVMTHVGIVLARLSLRFITRVHQY